MLADTSSINGAMVSTFGFNIYILYINIFIYIGPVVYVTVNTLKRAREIRKYLYLSTFIFLCECPYSFIIKKL